MDSEKEIDGLLRAYAAERSVKDPSLERLREDQWDGVLREAIRGRPGKAIGSCFFSWLGDMVGWGAGGAGFYLRLAAGTAAVVLMLGGGAGFLLNSDTPERTWGNKTLIYPERTTEVLQARRVGCLVLAGVGLAGLIGLTFAAMRRKR